MLEFESKKINKGQSAKQKDEENKFEYRYENQSQSKLSCNQKQQNQTQHLQRLQEELKQDFTTLKNAPQILVQRRNKSQTFQNTQYEQQNTALNEMIASKNQNIEVIIKQMEIQEKLMNMVVHDMRNPSEAINSGLSQAKQLITTQLEDISKELKISSDAYLQKIRQLNAKQNYFLQISQSFQMLGNLGKSQDQSQNDFDLSPNPASNQSDAIDNVQHINNNQNEIQANDHITPKRQHQLEESKKKECENDSIDQSENFGIQENNSPIIKRNRSRIEQDLQLKNQLINQPQNANRPDIQQQDFISQIQQFINFSGDNSGQILQNNENQVGFHVIEKENEIQINTIQQNAGQRLEQCIKDIHNNIQDLNKLIQENQIGIGVQNRQPMNQNDELQEVDNYSDFNQEDLDEVAQPQPPQNIQPVKNQINSQVNQKMGGNLIINQIRNINVHEGSQFVKRYRQKNNINAEVINAKEVYIFKENTVLKTESSIQTSSNEIDQNFKIQILNIMTKIKKNLQLLEHNENLIKLITDLKNSHVNAKQNEQPQRIQAIQKMNLLQQKQEMGQKQENEQLDKMKKIQQMMKQRRQSMSKVAYSSNLLKNNSVQQKNLQKERRFSLCHSQIINEVKKKMISPIQNQEKYLNKNIRQHSIQEINLNLAQKQSDHCYPKCESCKINIKMVVNTLQKLKQVFKIMSSTDFYVQNSISSANVISNLTEDLLTLAKIKNNVFELNIEQNVNLLQIVYEAFQVLSFNANSKNISFEFEHQKNRRSIIQNVSTDRRRILQILLNFISNSIKFTSQNGFIKVILKVVSETIMENEGIFSQQIVEQEINGSFENQLIEKKIQIQIQIQDNGAGISKENLNKLFSDFGKLNEHKQMNVKGTGLGLSICKQIIEQMGGNVKVQSKVGVGSKFIIQLDMLAFENISAINDSKKSMKELYPEIIVNNFLKIDKSGEEDIYLSSDNSDQNEYIIFKSRQSQQIGKNKVLFQFLHSNNIKKDSNKDKYQIQVNNIIKKIKYLNQEIITHEDNQQNQSVSNLSQRDQIQSIQDIFNKVQESVSKNQISQNIQKQISMILNGNNKKSNKSNENYASLNISENISSHSSSNNIKSQFNQERSNKNHSLSIESPSFRSSNHRKYINNQLQKSEEEEDEIQENELFEDIKNCNQENGNLNQIEEAIELSSQYLSQSGEQSNNNMSASFLKSQKSSQNNKNKIPLDFQKYLENNELLKQAIDISFKYIREKLNILVANDDSYQLFFIQTCIEKFENVSLVNTAQNGSEALDFVKKNERIIQQQDQQNYNLFNIIFLDIEMPIMDGNEACKQIQNHYYSYEGQISLKDYLKQIPFLKNKMNTINEHQKSQQVQQEQDEEWVIDLKKVYDIYQEIGQRHDSSQNMSREKSIQIQQKLKNEILKVFNILYQKLRYKSLRKLRRPFMFAYSAFINQKIIDETLKNGFDKCIEAPLNQLKIESLLDDYVENYCLNITKQMLEKLGPVPKFEEMIDFQKIFNGNKRKSSSLYSSLFRIQDRCLGSFKLNSNEQQILSYQQQNQQSHDKKLENIEQNMVLFKINETIQEQSQFSENGGYQEINSSNKQNLSICYEEEIKYSKDQELKILK